MPLPRMLVKRFLAYSIELDGPHPWNPQTHNKEDFLRVLMDEGVLGLGESYMDGLWSCDDLPEFFRRAVRFGLYEKLTTDETLKKMREKFEENNPQGTALQSAQNASDHYGQRNEIIQEMLDPRLTYTCALWQNPHDADDDESLLSAQERKLDLICRKLHLKPGMTMLDIGCGWGSLVGYAAEKYGVIATGVTPVPEQVAYVNDRYHDQSIKVIQGDYRDMEERFDAVVSVGMVEHVGKENLPAYMQTVSHCLKPKGISLLHVIGRSNPATALVDPWTEKYVFPGAYAVTPSDILLAAESRFRLDDVQEIGYHYGKTLTHWLRNIMPTLDAMDDRRFARMWEYYLASCAAMFYAEKLSVWQFVFTKQEQGISYRQVR